MDTEYGATNNWKAAAAGSGVVIQVYLNDSDTGDYDDDESGIAATKEVTGYIVGCQLTSSPSARIYKKWEDGTEEGLWPWEVLADSLDFDINCQEPPCSDKKEPQADFTWKLITDPPDTPVKGNITGSGTSWSDGTFTLFTFDSDILDGKSLGAIQVGIVLGGFVSIAWTPSWGSNDSVYALTGAGIGMGSNFGIACGEGYGYQQISDNTVKRTTHSAAKACGVGQFMGGTGYTREAHWKSHIDVKCDASTLDWNYAGGEAAISGQVCAKIPNNPFYTR